MLEYSPLSFYALLGLTAGLAGLSSYLYSARTVCIRLLISAFLYSGLVGVLSALVVKSYVDPESMELQAAAALAGGFSGPNLFDFVLHVTRLGILRIVISIEEDSHVNPPSKGKKQ